jgi:hypothetical protein
LNTLYELRFLVSQIEEFAITKEHKLQHDIISLAENVADIHIPHWRV